MNKPELKTPRKKRRRTCWDRLRARMLEAHRRRRANPAASAAAQLMTILSVLVGRMPLTPPMSVRYVVPPVSPAWARRKVMAQGLGIPVRYLDVVMARGRVPYTVLFQHIREGGVLRQDAMRVLRTRAPEASIDWLDYVELTGGWSDLLLCFVRNEYEEDTDIKLLKSTIAWLDTLNPSDEIAGPSETGTGMGRGLVPRPGGNNSDSTNNEGGPKGRRP